MIRVPLSEMLRSPVTCRGSTVERISNVLIEYYNERGYPFVQVCLDNLEQIEAGVIDVTMRLVVGPLTSFDTCEVVGVDRQTAAYLVRISDVQPGKRFSDRSIETS